MKNTNLHEFIRYTTGNVMGMLGLSCYILAIAFTILFMLLGIFALKN